MGIGWHRADLPRAFASPPIELLGALSPMPIHLGPDKLLYISDLSQVHEDIV